MAWFHKAGLDHLIRATAAGTHPAGNNTSTAYYINSDDKQSDRANWHQYDS